MRVYQLAANYLGYFDASSHHAQQMFPVLLYEAKC